MAKCLICNARKGKRKCIAAGGFICSQCCGTTRSFDKSSMRNYRKLPRYTVSEMAKSQILEDRANVL
ncbi:MAG: hypothetical protein ACQERN_07425 [Thermodesulfobacteriota bacterium]